jgi:CheY-like chemotaxis protein
MNPSPVQILLVEDNPGDARLAREALRETRVPTTLHVVADGVEALAFLRREGAYAGAPRPDVILLDLNLPRKGGREVLAEIKGDVILHRIPVIVLTSSKADEDVLTSYDLHANAYITKPVELDEFIRTVGTMEEFWLTVARLPPS